jgi:hypothetical protein
MVWAERDLECQAKGCTSEQVSQEGGTEDGTSMQHVGFWYDRDLLRAQHFQFSFPFLVPGYIWPGKGV